MLIIALMFEDHRAIVEEQGSNQGRGEPAGAVSMTTAPSTFNHLTPIRDSLPSLMMGIGRLEHWAGLGDCGTLSSVLPAACRVTFSETVGFCVSASPSLKW